MSFQDVEFLPSQASFSATFHENCRGCKCLGTTTCPRTVVGGTQHNAMQYKQCMLPVIYIRSSKASLCQLSFMEIDCLQK